MTRNKIHSLLSLASKAGKLKSGEFAVEKSVKDGSALMVIVADDSSDNTKKSYSDTCRHYSVPIYFYSTKEELGRSIGKELRAAVAVCDMGFAKGLEKLL